MTGPLSDAELADMLSTRETPEEIAASEARLARFLHPSMTWQVNGTLLGCRRAYDEITACGRTGELTVAAAGVPPCPKCYPQP